MQEANIKQEGTGLESASKGCVPWCGRCRNTAWKHIPDSSKEDFSPEYLRSTRTSIPALATRPVARTNACWRSPDNGQVQIRGNYTLGRIALWAGSVAPPPRVILPGWGGA